ncbi:hypothetical protein A0J48_019405 [Sphaerospermopsis aphanizomenoides BCCUSP55]|uniref:hypothetical protein n=1 Tax=Sphaerospermopsis aphanizomenoides TaxID=459663 RepID=UPI00190489F3|nr:hypothetical protein [Sphaerospermopsis aphanizomenoides]MBK1989674.1 hypothetical protein [Sphaerospermopsis aphanizomenoides BCCUSP55]
MKCINCGTDNTLKDRTANQGRCKQCNHRFTFEPTAMGKFQKITDSMFAKIISDLSANNTLFFTPKQLLYFLDNRLKKKGSSSIPVFIGLYIFFNIWVTGFFGGFSIPILLVLNAVFPINLPEYTTFIVVNLIFQLVTIFYLFRETNSPTINDKTRQALARFLQLIGFFIIIAGIILSVSIVNSFALFATTVIIGMMSIYLGTKQIGKVGLVQEFLFSQSEFQQWLTKWEQINGSLIKILPSPQEKITSTSINPDVTAYSFDRLVVCDSATIAQLLIANNFHFENNCAILSINGYPQSIFETTMEMLRRNPDLQVFALHDCSPKGVSLIHRLRTSENWFLNSNVTIIDVGLLPRQILANKRGMFVQNTASLAKKSTALPLEVRQTLSTEELAWLDAGNFVELESFCPQMLIKVLRGGISGSINLESDDSGLIVVGDSVNDIYMVESFG